MITFLDDPWVISGLIVLLFGALIALAVVLVIYGGKAYDEEFKGYGE